MNSKFMLLGALIYLTLINRISAQCLCATKGLDFCSCGATPAAPVRPVPKLIPRLPLPKFPPIGDSCWCGKQVVEPAIPPKPACKVCDTFEWLSTLKTLLSKKLLTTAIEVKKKCLGHMKNKLEKVEQLAALSLEPKLSPADPALPLPPAEAPKNEPTPSLLLTAAVPTLPLALLPSQPVPAPTPVHPPSYSYCSSCFT